MYSKTLFCYLLYYYILEITNDKVTETPSPNVSGHEHHAAETWNEVG